MKFRDFLQDASQAARSMVANPGEAWRRGFNANGEEGDLAAVLHYAEKGFPPGGKSASVFATKNTPLMNALLGIAKEMQEQGLLTTDRDGQGLTYVGEPNSVKELMRLTIRRKPGLLAGEEQHRLVGRILGYDDDAIDEFLNRLNGANKLHPTGY